MKNFWFKKIWLVLLMLPFLASTSLAARLIDNSVLSEVLGQGETRFDVAISNSFATKIVLGGPSDPKWRRLSDGGIDSLTYLNVPGRLTYGLLDKLSLRLTVPYAKVDWKSKLDETISGSGIANIELEGLYEFANWDNGALSLSGLLGVKLGTGKKISELATDEVYVGTRSNDVMLAGIVSKKFEAATGKILLGYLFTGHYYEQYTPSDPQFTVNLTDQIVYSLALMVPLGAGFEISGEFLGALSQGKEEWTISGTTTKVASSDRSYSIFSPLITYRVGDRFTLRGGADFILQKTAANTLSVYDLYQFTTYTISGTLVL